MEKTKKLISKKWRALAAIFFLAAFATNVQAQNVTIRANNGNMVASRPTGTSDYDIFFKCGGFASWQHEQLNMVLTVSDFTTLTENDQLANPANNLFSDGTHIQIAKGGGQNAYRTLASVSLPKGYRFTGYSIKFSKPSQTTKQLEGNSQTFNASNTSATFGETDETFGNYKTSAAAARGGAAVTISRQEMSEGEMGNVLYFKLNGSRSDEDRMLITLESAEFFFTAEEDYSPVTPAGTISSPVSAVDVPFTTSKVDFGSIERKQYDGVYRYSYSSANVKDLDAKLVLFEAESTKNGEGIDGISGEVVDYKAGSISSSGGYFKLNSGDANTEKVYYIETPTYVEVSNGEKVPVGYRITGAQFAYTMSTGQTVAYITYKQGNTTYYLNTNGRFENTTTPTEWKVDDDGCIYSGSTYLGFTVSGFINRTYTFGTFSSKPDYPLYVNNTNNRIYGTYRGMMNTYTVYLHGSTGDASVATNQSNLALWSVQTVTGDNSYTLLVYDKEGKNPQEITVDSDNPSGTVSIGGLNNDAVKFGVKGTGYVQATLTLQALDPYLDRMNVVCQDEVQTSIRMHQTFTASDFSVNGGVFYFYLPKEALGHRVAITFEDLHSKYFDDTYTGGSITHTSRINFVKSAHYNAFGTSNNNLYTNYAEAANATLERLKVGTVGTKKFKFNNAEDVGTSGGTLEEYSFSLENYTAEGGAFTDMKFTVSNADQHLVRYVFTTDETRYNISPATATQHRAYAFYEMEVHVQSFLYEPKVEFKPVYSSTCFEGDKNEAFYGVEITAPDGAGKPGYASTNKIFEKIEAAITAKKDDFGNTDCPADAKHILYLDFSKLLGVYQVADATHSSMDDYSADNAANCLIFLPKGSSAPNNNVAAQLESGEFKAANNIVLTDKQPFYSPYDILVDGANTAQYKRQITWATQGKNTLQTLLLPFTLRVTNGVHEEDNGVKFTLNKMKASNCLSIDHAEDANAENFKAKAYFEPITDEASSANVPYMVDVTSAPTGEDKDYPFTITQRGATIKATTSMDKDNYLFKGETASGSINGASYSFQNQGSYSGKELKASDGYFYYAGGMFLNSKNIRADLGNKLYVYPFRAYYSYNASGGAKQMGYMEIIFGENETTGIDAFETAPAEVDMDAPVYDMTGRMIAPAMRNLAGKKLPRGMYVVNGVKIIVK